MFACMNLGTGIFRFESPNWIPVNTGLTNTYASSIIGDGAYVLAGTGLDLGGVFRSTNNGDDWAPSNGGLTTAFITGLDTDGSNIFASSYGGAFYSSADGGETCGTRASAVLHRRMHSV